MTNRLRDKHILLGVSGGIAAYKAPQLVRLLRQSEAQVQVVMTRSAHRFVTATTLQAVSGRAIRDDLWDEAAEASMGHIELARWADTLLIAPATADCLARLAQGRADDLLTALCLASEAPLVVAPAMNQIMWQAPATQRNLATVRADGGTVLGPDSGDQACGETGPGRMMEPEAIVAALQQMMAADRVADVVTGAPRTLAGRHVVVTAGPTREAIDPVRYISNHSSGRQGYAFAEAARDAGARVTLISGPVDLPQPAGMEVLAVSSAQEMYDVSMRLAPTCDLFVAVAAVADYRPQAVATQKIKKTATSARGELTLTLTENPDIVAAIAALEPRPVVLGFAAETQDALAHARTKLERKGLDAIVVNDVSQPGIGFNSPDNAATLILAETETPFPKQNKYDLACAVLAVIAARFEAQLAHTNPEDVAM